MQFSHHRIGTDLIWPLTFIQAAWGDSTFNLIKELIYAKFHQADIRNRCLRHQFWTWDWKPVKLWYIHGRKNLGSF